MTPAGDETITLGISACLTGQKVRYNGEHKRSGFVVNDLSKLFAFKPVCPEVGIGMGTPREPIRLVGQGEDYHAVGTDHSENDFTDQLTAYGEKTATDIADSISGYILMQKSPSCGMERVKIYHPNGNPLGASGPGIFARTLMQCCPLLPVEEEGRLHDPVLRENFFTRVFAWHRWQRDIESEPTYAGLQAFHAAYKYVLMAHSPQNYQKLGQIVSVGKQQPVEKMAEEYKELFMATLKQRATRRSHTNVLQHLAGYVKKELDAQEKEDLNHQIEQYRLGVVPLSVPMALLRHFLNRHGSDYVKEQVYLQPHPEALGLRNTI